MSTVPASAVPPVAAGQTAITVVICTHNRAGYLDKALESLAAQTAAPGSFDVLVVDNASTDDTRRTVAHWQMRCPRIRYVREDRLGLSHARNRGLGETTSAYIAYLDDDAIAEPQWVETVLRAFASHQPIPAAVGGPVHPIWETSRPPWLPDSLLGLLTVVQWQGGSRFLDLRREFIAGANMAFARDRLAEIGFDTSLGRVGQKLLSGEEILLMRLLLRNGEAVYYDTGASVRHHVPANRLNKRWFYRRVCWDGLSLAIINIRLHDMNRRRRIESALKELGRHVLRGHVWRVLPFVGEPRARLAARCQSLRVLWMAYGYLSLG